MTINLESLSVKELDALIVKATKRKGKLEARPAQAEIRRMLAELARKHGYSLEEMFGDGSAPRRTSKGGKVPAKYRHPQSGATWSGRGKPPRWLAAEIAAGKKASDFAIGN